MELEKSLYICDLCEIYGKMLTENQLKIMQDYFFNNLTLSEISSNLNITRQAVNDTIKKSQNTLIILDNALGLYDKIKDIELLGEKSGKKNIILKVLNILKR